MTHSCIGCSRIFHKYFIFREKCSHIPALLLTELKIFPILKVCAVLRHLQRNCFNLTVKILMIIFFSYLIFTNLTNFTFTIILFRFLMSLVYSFMIINLDGYSIQICFCFMNIQDRTGPNQIMHILDSQRVQVF